MLTNEKNFTINYYFALKIISNKLYYLYARNWERMSKSFDWLEGKYKWNKCLSNKCIFSKIGWGLNEKVLILDKYWYKG